MTTMKMLRKGLRETITYLNVRSLHLYRDLELTREWLTIPGVSHSDFRRI